MLAFFTAPPGPTILLSTGYGHRAASKLMAVTFDVRGRCGGRGPDRHHLRRAASPARRFQRRGRALVELDGARSSVMNTKFYSITVPVRTSNICALASIGGSKWNLLAPFTRRFLNRPGILSYIYFALKCLLALQAEALLRHRMT